MHPLQLHPLSVLVGLGIAALAFVAMGQTPQVIDPVARRPGQPAAVIAARDMVQIRGSAAFVVPQGKLFVLTALGDNGGGPNPTILRVNGQVEIAANQALNGQGNGTTMKLCPTGFAVPEGSTITVDEGVASSDARAWGQCH